MPAMPFGYQVASLDSSPQLEAGNLLAKFREPYSVVDTQRRFLMDLIEP
jgi:hypothetical protein